jgi:hypothetical protein
MNATEARTTLLAQHERIRELLQVCTSLAGRARDDQEVVRELDRALVELRDTFAQHNQDESAIIGELLRGPAAWGALLVDRMLEEHVAEHAAFWDILSRSSTEIVDRIGDLAEELDAHIAAEERTFLSPVTLREDVIRARNGGTARE